MRPGIRLHLVHVIVLSFSVLIPDHRCQEFFCFRTKSEPGRSQYTFLRRPSAEESVLFYWTVWADHRVEECFISAEAALIQNYMSLCHEQGIWDQHNTSGLLLNMTLLMEPGNPCDFRPSVLSNMRWHRDLHTSSGSGTAVRQKRAWILPGTLWCGQGSRAGDYEQLGMFEHVDRCCREHDHCKHMIRPFTVNFGVFNPTLFTISHCDCDHRFKHCLLNINDTVSNMVGYTFFNILKLKCFELIQKKRCTKINWIGMCTSDKVAPFAILKHSTLYNATTLNTGIPEPPLCEEKPSGSTKQKNMKREERKQLTSQKNCVPGASAAGHTVLLTEIIGQPYGTPETPVSTTAQPNCLRSCNTTFLNLKSKLRKQSTPLSAGASSTTTYRASTRGIASPSIQITQKKSKNITKLSLTTVQTKFTKKLKPLTSKLKGDPPRADRFQSKQQRRKDYKQNSITVSPKFLTLSLASNLSRTNKYFKSMSQTKKKTNSQNRKNSFNGVLSKSPRWNASTSEMKHKSAKVTKLPKTRNNISAHETFKQTAICDVTRQLDDCKYRIHPMEKLYGHHNTGTTTIYHCDCIHRLTGHLKQLESIGILKKLLWKFVSIYCIEIPNSKKCSSSTRCSAILYKATELESSLIKLESQVKNRKISPNKRVSNQLYKRCLRILRQRSPNQEWSLTNAD